MNKAQISFAMQDVDNLKDLIKIEAIDGKVNMQSAQEYLRILDEVNERLLKIL